MFRKIGQYEIRAEGDVIYVWSSPVFNLESAQEYAADMTKVIDGMPPRFGVIAQFETPPILGPEVEAAMRESARQRAARGMIAVALVTMDRHGLSIASGQWNRIYDPSGIPHAFFADLESARTWMRGLIGAKN
ncbi:MAG TPA: hypothetical protein VFB32_11865 [Rudaea sp.]|nr:hypothetical protein [Rudaea sp.]